MTARYAASAPQSRDYFLGACTAQICFFDAVNTILGLVNASGANAELENCAMPYLGGFSDAQDINYVLFNTLDAGV